MSTAAHPLASLPRRSSLGRAHGPRALIAAVALAAGCGGTGVAVDATPTAIDAPTGPPTRALVDRPDQVTGPQIHVFYVVPADGVDRQLDVDGSLVRTVSAWNGWLAARSGGPRFRLDLADGALDITFVRLAATDATIAAEGVFVRDRLERDLADRGLLASTKLAAVYYDGTSTVACGGGPWPPTLVGKVAALYLRGLPDGPLPCVGNPLSSDGVRVGYLEFAMLHEVFHALGAAPACAPHQTASGHTSDGPTDLMYAGAEVWLPGELDRGRDDYWGHGRVDCLDVARSALLDPTPAGATLPPGW